MKRFWLVMCVLGTVVPYAVFLPWVMQHGLDVTLLVEQASEPIAAFAWLDVILSAVVVLVLAGRSIARGHRAMWAVVVGTLCVGVSLGLPLYLYLSDAGDSV